MKKDDLITLLHTLRRMQRIKPKPGYRCMETRFETSHTSDAGSEAEVSYVISQGDLSMLIRGLEALP